MKFSRLLLIIGIVVLVSVFAMSTSFAASKKSESIYSDKISQYISEDSYKTKISEIKKTDIVSVKKGGYTRKGNFKISVKNSFKNKYKIKSVTVVYKHRYTDDIMDEVEKKVYKTYKPKNKKILAIKDLSASESLGYEFVKIIINYKTSKKMKQETTYLKKYYKYKSTTKYTGKTAIVKDITVSTTKNFVHTIKVKTTNFKYKIKTFKVIFHNYIDIIGTIYGHGKNSLVVKGPMHYDPRSEGDFEITYY
ncbi:hypothetical protein [Methanobrevibacter curvatus]|uniref:Uncharacterized protein n=1 Tax=Methanobrevibacter curvatus TaxID=49547 RepID=A0A166CTX9_9EURY|nr:hypothetical protein [Methanobrevibacter curvatus]KZX14861.1 hypothetical protein MBCUR_03500 [Methanobrevibacter curvatus]